MPQVIVNTLTALFVETSLSNAERDHAKLLKEELNKRDEYVKEVRRLFLWADADGDGELSLEEFQRVLNRHEHDLMIFASSLRVEIDDLETVFNLLSHDGQQKVDVEAFVVGCIRVRGMAKSSDLNALIHEHRRSQEGFHCFRAQCEGQLRRIEQTLLQATQSGSDRSGVGQIPSGQRTDSPIHQTFSLDSTVH